MHTTYMHLLKIFILFSSLLLGGGTRVVGWWVADQGLPAYPLEKFPWDIYTHIKIGGPVAHQNSSVFCNKTDYNFHYIVKQAHKHKTKIIWGSSLKNIHDILWNPKAIQLRNNYINSIGKAAHECNVDGVEVDYEFSDSEYMKLGVVTPEESTHYSHFLSDIKTALGPKKEVSADVSIWGFAPGNYLLGVFPWINATMLNRGDFDYINTMSYHWNKQGNLWSWKKDGWFIDIWGIDRSRINIGIPYFSKEWRGQKIVSEPIWRSLSPSCPNIDPVLNICRNITFVGKNMNFELGKWIASEGFGGVFPWAANYDSIEYNNSLVEWLYRGLTTR